MTSYRERDEAPPRPLTWTQRAGMACMFVGTAIIFAYIAGRLGLVRPVFDSPVPGTAFVAIAAPLVAWRSGPLSQEIKRQRLALIFIAAGLCVLVAALTLYFKGA